MELDRHAGSNTLNMRSILAKNSCGSRRFFNRLHMDRLSFFVTITISLIACWGCHKQPPADEPIAGPTGFRITSPTDQASPYSPKEKVDCLVELSGVVLRESATSIKVSLTKGKDNWGTWIAEPKSGQGMGQRTCAANIIMPDQPGTYALTATLMHGRRSGEVQRFTSAPVRVVVKARK